MTDLQCSAEDRSSVSPPPPIQGLGTGHLYHTPSKAWGQVICIPTPPFKAQGASLKRLRKESKRLEDEEASCEMLSPGHNMTIGHMLPQWLWLSAKDYASQNSSMGRGQAFKASRLAEGPLAFGDYWGCVSLIWRQHLVGILCPSGQSPHPHMWTTLTGLRRLLLIENTTLEGRRIKGTKGTGGSSRWI